MIRYTPRTKQITQGPCTLYCLSPTLVKEFIDSLTDEQIKASQDDPVFSDFLVGHGIKINTSVGSKNLPFIFHDDLQPLTKGQRRRAFYAKCFTHL